VANIDAIHAARSGAAREVVPAYLAGCSSGPDVTMSRCARLSISTGVRPVRQPLQRARGPR
jgi:hypothetical protein